jgi:hypothetical protein
VKGTHQNKQQEAWDERIYSGVARYQIIWLDGEAGKENVFFRRTNRLSVESLFSFATRSMVPALSRAAFQASRKSIGGSGGGASALMNEK